MKPNKFAIFFLLKCVKKNKVTLYHIPERGSIIVAILVAVAVEIRKQQNCDSE